MAHTHLSLAKIYLKNKMLKLAIQHFKKAQKHGKTSFDNNIFTAQTLLGIGDTYSILKEPKEALTYHKQAYELINKQLYLKSEKVSLLYAMAKDYIELKNNKKAIKQLKEALQISHYKKGEMSAKTVKINNLLGFLEEERHFKISLKSYKLLYGRHSLELADLYRDMAEQKEQKGVYQEALNDYKKAIAIYNKKLPLLHSKSYTTYHKIASLDKKLQHKSDYYKDALKAFDGFFQNQELIFSTLSSHEKQSYIKKHKSYMVDLFDASSNQAPQQLFNRWLNFKRKLYDEENALALVESKVKNRTRLHKLKEHKRLLARHYQAKSLDKGSIDALEKKITELEGQLSLNFFYYKKSKKPIDYTQISRLLKPDECYIDIANVDKSYYIFILDSNNKLKLEKINRNNSSKLDSLLKFFIEDSNKNSKMKTNLMQYHMSKLHTVLLPHLQLKNIHSIILSPDGLLNSIPFEALYNKEKREYLIEKVAISYIPSGRELIKLSQREKSSKQETILFGRSNFSEVALEKLEYTQKEIEKIHHIYPHAKVFLENKATSTELFKLNSPKILHLATHGSYKQNSKQPNPLLNIHLYLDRAISGLEISGLNLNETELVVVSACQTALGKMEDFEGVSSISKAFMEAGAKNTIVSLWNIDDKATSVLMQRFYQYLKEGKNYKQALREAKLSLLKEKDSENPYLWSALIQIGFVYH